MIHARPPLLVAIWALVLALLLGLPVMGTYAGAGTQTHQAGLTLDVAKALLPSQHRLTPAVADQTEDATAPADYALPSVSAHVQVYVGAGYVCPPFAHAHCPPARGPPAAAS